MKEMFGLRYQPTRFSTREAAISYANHANKLWVVEFGGRFYTTCPADAAKLEKQGGKIIC